MATTQPHNKQKTVFVSAVNRSSSSDTAVHVVDMNFRLQYDSAGH